MLNISPEQLNFSLALQFELAWLEANHPEKHELIQLVNSHLNTLRQAGSTDSFNLNDKNPFAKHYKLEGLKRLNKEDQHCIS